mgnify:FL=1
MLISFLYLSLSAQVATLLQTNQTSAVEELLKTTLTKSNNSPTPSILKAYEALFAHTNERVGLASLLVDREAYDEAIPHLTAHISDPSNPFLPRATSMLYRCNIAACNFQATSSISLPPNVIAHFHPFEALKYQPVSLSEATGE